MSYCVKKVFFVINMKVYRDVLVQQVIGKIRDIQNIDSFECTRKIFEIGAIVIPSYITFSQSITFLILTYNINCMSLYNKSFDNRKISTSY
jgi:hypothetical protein